MKQQSRKGNSPCGDTGQRTAMGNSRLVIILSAMQKAGSVLQDWARTLQAKAESSWDAHQPTPRGDRGSPNPQHKEGSRVFSMGWDKVFFLPRLGPT